MGQAKILAVDEAQYLRQLNRGNGLRDEVFEWLRDASEKGRFKIVFCGDKGLAQTVSEYPQLLSRMVRPVVVNKVTEADIIVIAGCTSLTSRPAINALQAVAKLPGGLRNVENVIRIATAFANPAQPNVEHLKAAIMDMNLVSRGVTKLDPKGNF